MRIFAAFTLCVCVACVHAQTGSQPEVRLEAHEGKTHFQIGEPIQLDLVLSNPTSTPMMVNATDYGDNSDPVDISPKTGWTAWQGQSGHDYAVMSQLRSEPVRVPIRVDQVAIFHEPGHYEVRVTENRVQGGGDLLHLSQGGAVTTNAVGIDLEAMPEGHEAEIVRGVVNDLANATNDRAGSKLSRAAVVRLAALQGNAALDEKVKLLIAEQGDFRQVETEAWATTRDLKRQLDLIQAAWRNPQVNPAYDMPSAMDETRRLLAGRPLMGWRMTVAPSKSDAVEQQLSEAHRQDMVNMLNSMPQRTGESRRSAAYYLVEFGGLSDADQPRAREYAIQEFPQMEDVAQHMILETARPPVRDARLLPTLRTLLDHNPADKDALAALLDIAPEEATPYIVRAVCASEAPPLIDTFAKVNEDRLPQVDECLLPLLRGQAASVPNPGRANFVWKQRVTLAARFGTPALLTAIESSGVQQLAANPNDSGIVGALLAAEMRDDPKAALARLQHGVNATSWYETSKVFESLHRPFPPLVDAWFQNQVRTGNEDIAGQATYELSIAGTNQDRAVIEQRLATFRAKAASEGSEPTSILEVNLVTSLLNSKSWALTPEERVAVTRGCVTESCRQYAPH